ncbi:MAG: hypothetical protein L0Z50_31210 [Verrucomicrobiales bacterium]|nr:hypothetical protein [Verrucomicrobiales bacterium]
MTSAVRAQNTNKSAPKAKLASEQPADGNNLGKPLDHTASSEPARGNQPERPERANRAATLDPSEELTKIREEFKQAQTRFVEEEKELRQKLKEATNEDRARIRNEIQTKRQNFVDAQREVRDEMRRLMIDLKDRLKDHQDVIDAAKEGARDKVKGRKGGGD